MVQPAPPAAFNKFNSLDRRALMARRHQNNLKLTPASSTSGHHPHLHHHHHGHLGSLHHGGHLGGGPHHSGSESLPLPQQSPAARQFLHHHQQQQQQQQPVSVGGQVEIVKKEPERRHSSYDSSTVGRTTGGAGGTGSASSRFNAARQSIVNAAAKHAAAASGGNGNGGGGGLSAMNINGLPDPRGGIYSSHESLRTTVSTSGSASQPSTRSSRPGAGTPQFQNLSGAVRNAAAAAISALTQPQSLKSRNGGGGSGSNGGANVVSVGGASSSSSGCSSSEMAPNVDTPSPSDSAVGDLETMLKEKDTEINYLRETMEQNEQVIFKVRAERARAGANEPRMKRNWASQRDQSPIGRSALPGVRFNGRSDEAMSISASWKRALHMF